MVVVPRIAGTPQEEQPPNVRFVTRAAEGKLSYFTAVRRLRSWLRAYEAPLRGSVSGKDRDALRAVSRATNAGRDAEVHVEWLRARPEFFGQGRGRGTEWLIKRLQARGRVRPPLPCYRAGSFFLTQKNSSARCGTTYSRVPRGCRTAPRLARLRRRGSAAAAAGDRGNRNCP